MPDNKSDWNQVTKLIGEVTVAWNSCHEAIFLIFWQLTKMPHAAAESVFFTIMADSAQREITLALAKSRLTEKNPLFCELQSIMKEIVKLAGERNAAIHTMWDGTIDGPIKPSSLVTKHKPKLEQEHFIAQFKELAASLFNISPDLFRIFLSLSELPPFPDKEPLEILRSRASLEEDVQRENPESPPLPQQSLPE